LPDDAAHLLRILVQKQPDPGDERRYQMHEFTRFSGTDDTLAAAGKYKTKRIGSARDRGKDITAPRQTAYFNPYPHILTPYGAFTPVSGPA
jgi:hypothetical protein